MADVTTNQTVPVVSNVSPADKPVTGYRDAFQKALPAAKALDLDDLIIINIDVATAVTTALGSLPEILALRERAKTLSEFDLTQLDELGTYARATMHAHGEWLAATAPPEALQAINDEGLALRDLLYSDAVALSKRGLVNSSPLSEFKKEVGYKNLATDLVGLSSLLRNSWAQIDGKTAMMQAEIDRAEELSEKLLMAVGAREQAPAVIAEVAQMRQRMFTLFVQAYDQARRVVGFLRWREGDLETIAPSLYAGRNKSRRTEPTQPAAPVVAPATVSPGAPATAAAGAVAPAATPPVASGLPGSSPFSVGN